MTLTIHHAPAQLSRLPFAPQAPALHFERKKDKPETEKAPKGPSRLTKWCARQIANLYTRPTLVKKWVPNTSHMVDEKYLNLFQPIQKLDFKSLDGLTLKGYWLPATTESNQTMVLGHGYSADWRKPLETVQKLRAAGINCFLFDFRAHGKSAGERTTIGFHEGKDIAAALQTVREKFPQQAQRLFYYGHSMGAAAYMMMPESIKGFPETVASIEQNLKGAVLDSGFYSFDEIAQRFIKDLDSVSGGHWGARYLATPALNGKFGDSLLTAMKSMVEEFLKLPINPFQVIPAEILAKSPLAKKPTMILHGTLDNVTPFSHAERVAKTLQTPGSTNVTFTPLEGESHFRVDWQPVPKSKKYWTLERANLAGRLTQFVNGVTFAGKLRQVKRLAAA
jgi:alpha-beta hydrolase superfamily lysophospholipase